jgi:hypothetical protein
MIVVKIYIKDIFDLKKIEIGPEYNIYGGMMISGSADRGPFFGCMLYPISDNSSTSRLSMFIKRNIDSDRQL